MAKGVRKPVPSKKNNVSQKTETGQPVAPNTKKGLAGKNAEIEKLIIQKKTAVIERPTMPINKKTCGSKKAELDKPIVQSKEATHVLIVQSKENVSAYMDRSPPKICLPPGHPNATVMTAPSMRPSVRKYPHVSRQISPKQVQPCSIQDSEDKILDIRHQYPGMPLLRIPCEPEGRGPLRNFQPKGVFLFLNLPGELRNKIYGYVIKKYHYMIEWVDNKCRNKSLTYWIPDKNGKKSGPFLRLKTATAHRRHMLDSPGGRVRQRLPVDYFRKTPVAPLLVCKQMHKEASSVFYSKCTFDFHGLRALDHFLDKLLPVAKSSITHLFIKYRAYGHPEETVNKWIKYKHDSRWEMLCWRISEECSSLTHLSLNLTLNKSPVSFCAFDDAEVSGLGAEWILPLHAFRGVNVKRCWARVHCPVKERSVLELESWKIRKEILGKNWDEEAENERDAFGRDIKPKPEQVPKELTASAVIRICADGQVESA